MKRLWMVVLELLASSSIWWALLHHFHMDKTWHWVCVGPLLHTYTLHKKQNKTKLNIYWPDLSDLQKFELPSMWKQVIVLLLPQLQECPNSGRMGTGSTIGMNWSSAIKVNEWLQTSFSSQSIHCTVPSKFLDSGGRSTSHVIRWHNVHNKNGTGHIQHNEQLYHLFHKYSKEHQEEDIVSLLQFL